MAEQLAFNQAFGDGSAIDSDERSVAARRARVNHSSGKFLPGAALTREDDGCAGSGDLFDQADNPMYPWRPANHGSHANLYASNLPTSALQVEPDN
jgi:hypothetical protein